MYEHCLAQFLFYIYILFWIQLTIRKKRHHRVRTSWVWTWISLYWNKQSCNIAECDGFITCILSKQMHNIVPAFPTLSVLFFVAKEESHFFGKRNENRATEVEKCTLVSSTKWCRKMIIVSFIVTETPVAFVEPTLHQYFILLQTKFLQVLTNVWCLKTICFLRNSHQGNS